MPQWRAAGADGFGLGSNLYRAGKAAADVATSRQELARVQDFPNNVKRTIGESIVLLTWHDAHHQGQIHLTWNLYKAAHGIA